MTAAPKPKAREKVAKPRKPRKPIKPKKRSADEFQRIYGSRERVRWIKSLPCLVCNCLSPFLGDYTRGKCENAHTAQEGLGRKGHYTTIIPLCPNHHRRLDRHIPPLNTDVAREALRKDAAKIEKLWQAHNKENKTMSADYINEGPY